MAAVIMSTGTFDGDQRKPKGAVLFTGPDGIGDFKVRVKEPSYIGHGCMSPEASSDTKYLYRAAENCPHPPPKTARVGEIGWGVPGLSDTSQLRSGHQIMLKEFRQAVEDRHTHLYQNPYYPPPEKTVPRPPQSKTVTLPTIAKEPEQQDNVSDQSTSIESLNAQSSTTATAS